MIGKYLLLSGIGLLAIGVPWLISLTNVKTAIAILLIDLALTWLDRGKECCEIEQRIKCKEQKENATQA